MSDGWVEGSLTGMAMHRWRYRSMSMGMDEVERAQALARRYHAEFVDLKNFKISA